MTMSSTTQGQSAPAHAATPEPLVWTCTPCGQEILGDTGYVAATYRDINSDGPIRWSPAHDWCLPDQNAYAIDTIRLATTHDALWWTDHLSDKNWYHRSDWRALLAGKGIDVTPAEHPPEPTEQHSHGHVMP
jgi:hypothetical protein